MKLKFSQVRGRNSGLRREIIGMERTYQPNGVAARKENSRFRKTEISNQRERP